MACLFLPHNETAYAGERFNQSTALTTEQLTASSIDDAASRSSQREDLTVDGTWDMGDRPEGKLTFIHADNPVVRDLINGRDEDQTPTGFNPDHATGDTGNGLIRFYMEAGNGSMQVDVPEETARSIARWILDHTNA